MQTEDNRKESVENRQENEILADKDFEFMREKIKERPINRRRLLRRTMITASLAVIFGLVACFTFLVLEPVFSNWLYPEEDPKQYTLPEVEEEMLPEDMLQEDPVAGQTETAGQEEGQTGEVMQRAELEIADYQVLYNKLYTIAQGAFKSMVTVTGVTSDVDLFDNMYENTSQTSGLIVEMNEKELLLLANKTIVEEAETIQVTFNDGTQATAVIKASDAGTGLAIVGVPLESLTEETKKKIVPAELGSSNVPGLTGTPVVMVGSPVGNSGSVVYGMLTSVGNPVGVVDNYYKSMKTDKYGSASAAGVILDMQGQVIGIIDMRYNEEDTQNLISAIGITELKKTIAKMSLGQQMAYLGVYGNDVTTEANEELGVPFGAYVKEIVMESPAMNAGIQSGDIIVKIGDDETDNFNGFINALLERQPGDTAEVTVMRQGKEAYQEMTFEVTFGLYEP